MITCPNKNLPEWLELEQLVPDLAYTIWDLNNGNGIDKAPNGAESILFKSLLEHHNGDRNAAVLAKSKIYFSSFREWFGDWVNAIKPNEIIYGHPGIGKTYSFEQGKHKDSFIDWDVEFNSKRDLWIENKTNTKKGTEEYKKARNEYLIYPEKHKDYVDFITKEWERVKNKARQENKILFASPHVLLRLFPNDFTKIINLKEDDFVKRNIARGGKEKESLLWKAGIDNTINSLKNNIQSEYLNEGEYLEDYLDKKTNVSKVVDENGEPIVMYHGGAKYITEFRTGGEENSNTGYGTYTDHKTGEKIPVDSNRTMFFSNEKYVAQSYGYITGISYYSTLRGLVESLISTTHNGTAGIDLNIFKSIDDFYNTLDNLSENNQRFAKLKDYIIQLKAKGERLTAKEAEGFRKMLIDARDQLRKLSDLYNMVGSEWEYHLSKAKELLNEYANEAGVKRLLSGEIPEILKREYEIYKKIEKNRNANGQPKIANYEDVKMAFTNMGRYYIGYDGKLLFFWLPDYVDKTISEFSEEDLLDFLKDSKKQNEIALKHNKEENLYASIRSKSQLYPVFLNIKNPLVHDYEGTHLGLGYKYSKEHPFGYVAARLVDKAIREGNDGVIYKNLYDPFLADNYGVFDPNQIKSIDNIGTFSTENNNIYYQKGNIDFYRGMLEKRKELESSFEADNKLSDRMLQELEDNGLLTYQEDEELFVNEGMRKYLEDKQEMLSNELYHHLRALYPEVELNFVEGLETAPDAKGMYFLPTNTIDIVLPLATMDTIPHEYAHHYIRMFINTAIVLAAIKEWGSEEALVQAIGEQAVKQEGKAWGWWNQFISWLKEKFDINTKEDKERLKNLLTDAFLTRKNLNEVSYKANLDLKLRTQSVFFQNTDKLSKVYEKIITGLRGRLTSLNRRSTLKDLNTLNELSNVIDLLATLEAKDGVIAFIDHVNDTINTSKLFLSKKTSEINSKLLIQLKRDYLGFYTPMVKSLKDILDTTELLNDIPEAEEFKSTVDNLLLTLETLNNKYNLILETKTKEFVIEYATNAGSPFVNDLVEWLDNPSNDISFLGYFVGLSSSTNNEMIRIMENIIRNQKNITDMETLYEGKNIIALLNEAKKSYGSDIMSALLEFSKDGKRTGYFVRDRNYGMFHDALSKELERLALKYNLEKGSDGKYILPEDTVELRRYTKDLNKWYSKHADRRYVPEYYEHKNRILSLATIEAQSNILKRINLITNNITRDGIVREDLLTDSQLDELDRLYAERKNLSNFYNFDGSRKTGEDLDIALELREFNELVNENVKYKTDYAKFNKARDLMIEKYGIDSPEFKKWISRNNVLVYTDKFWKLLDMLQAPTFATKEDLELHDELVGRRRELHKLYRKRNSLEIDVTKLNEDEILMLKELDIKIASLRQYVKADEDSITFKDVAKIVNTKEYYAVYMQKQQEALTKNDPKIFQDWYEANHYEDRRGKMHPVSVWTYIQPVNMAHVEYQPSSKWSEPDLENSNWVNKDYEPNSEEAILPKKALYDNSDAFNKIKNNKEAFALYNALIDSMDRSLSKLSFLTHSNKYRLPQMTARTMLMVGRESNIFKGLGYMVKDEFTIKDDDKDYVPTFDRRPDGSLIKLIPTKYLKPLDNPSMISADTVGSVIEFFNMAENYKLMSKVKDDLEMLLDRMSQLEYNKDNKFKAAGTLNVFKKAESLLDMHLYGKRKNQAEATILGKKINITKALSKIYGIAGTINLAFNMWAMATNAITGKGYTVMESTLGRYFNKQDFAWAEKNYYKSLPKIMLNLGNPNDTTKLMFMCLLNQVARSNAETFSNLDLSPVLRAINQHFWYNGYTAGDFAVKSTILGAVYHSYRLVTTPDGSKQFMTREDYVSKYYADAPLTGRVKFDEFDVTLYDVYELDKNTYKVKDEYRQYVTVNLTNMVKNKIQTIAARIDGNINDTDRAAIHANAYALFLVMHRNFMIVGLQDRFKKTQFNYNTGVLEEGIYRSIPKLFNGAFSDGGLNVIHNMIQNYHNMQDYEQYAVRKVITELGTILGVSLLVSLLLVPLADDTDDDWALEALTYIAMRTAFEFRTLYQPLELTALLNSPSAAFSSITNAAEMLKLIWIPNYFSDNSSPFKEISTGAYKGMPKLLRNFIKVTPFKNVIEASDPKAKRKYLDNQLAF